MAGNSSGTRSSGTGHVSYYDSSTLMPNVYVVGAVGDPRAQIVRIVHISDTHEHHINCLDTIPFGHILVHSGDFGNYSLSSHFFKERNFRRQIDSMNDFFSKLPHEFKIFVSGNHDQSFDRYSSDYIQSILTNAVYLQDNSCTLYGLKIFGLPWNRLRNGCYARSFAKDWDFVRNKWAEIPTDTDVLISHMPPWSSEIYPDISKKIKPTVHLFGHDHTNYGIKWKDKILFSNAALAPHQLEHQRRQLARSTGSSYAFSGGGSSGSSSRTSRAYPPFGSGSAQYRRPIVIDVYVVSEDFRCELPSAFLQHAERQDNNSEEDVMIDSTVNEAASKIAACETQIKPLAPQTKKTSIGNGHVSNVEIKNPHQTSTTPVSKSNPLVQSSTNVSSRCIIS